MPLLMSLGERIGCAGGGWGTRFCSSDEPTDADALKDPEFNRERRRALIYSSLDSCFPPGGRFCLFCLCEVAAYQVQWGSPYNAD